MFQWFLWDFDGTLFDTYPAANAALLESLAAWGIREDPEETMARLKVRQGPAVQYFQEKHRLPEGRLFEEFRRREALLVPKSKPFPEADALCREIVRRGGRNLLYTHRDRLALKMMESAGLAPFFSGGVTAEDGLSPRRREQDTKEPTERKSIGAGGDTCATTEFVTRENAADRLATPQNESTKP